MVGARDLGRVFAGEQHRVLADDGEPGGICGEGLGDAFIEPAGRAVETPVGREAESGERQLLVGEDRRHEAPAGLVGLRRDPSRQRERSNRRREEEVLARLKPQPDLDRRLGEPVELGRVDRREIARLRGHRNSGGKGFVFGIMS